MSVAINIIKQGGPASFNISDSWMYVSVYTGRIESKCKKIKNLNSKNLRIQSATTQQYIDEIVYDVIIQDNLKR